MSRSLLDHFSALSDPRQAGKVLYPLQEILLLVLCGTMAGAEDFMEIERWGRRKLGFLRPLAPFARGVPSHDTLNDVMPSRSSCDCSITSLAHRDAVGESGIHPISRPYPIDFSSRSPGCDEPRSD